MDSYRARSGLGRITSARPLPGWISGATRGTGTLALALGVLAGCTPQLHAIPVEPGVDFAAHVEHRGLVVDRAADLRQAVLVPGGSGIFSNGPRFLLKNDGKTVAALWFPEPGQMIVRQSASPQSPLIGEVDARWKHGAIRLTLKPAHGSPLRTGAFDRIDGRVSTVALSSQAQTVLDVRGEYRAELRDAQGAPAGWLRAEISPHQAAMHIYDGVVPASVNGPLATAAVALLDADVSHIEEQAANVYLGN